MRQWIGPAWVQIMGCRLFGAKSLSKNQCWDIVNWTLMNKFKLNFNQNTKPSIHENASENIVCEKAAILPRGRWVNTHSIPYHAYRSYICVGKYGNIGKWQVLNYWFYVRIAMYPRADSSFAPSQWEPALLCNDVSHWLGANLDSAPFSF